MSNFNKNFLFPDSNMSTQFPTDAENSQLNRDVENSQLNHGYNLVNYSSNDVYNSRTAYPMMQPPSGLNISKNLGGSNIPNDFPSGQLLSTNIPFDNSLPNEPQNQDSSEPFYIDSHEKDDYSLSYIVRSGMEICSTMSNSGASGRVTTMAESPLMPQGQIGTSNIGYNQSYPNVLQTSKNHSIGMSYNQSYSNVVHASQNRPIGMPFRTNQGTYSRNYQQMGNYQGGASNSRKEGYHFTVLNSQDPHPVTLPQVTSGGATTRRGPIEARRQASSVRQYQLLPKGTSSNQRLSRLSRSSSANDYMRWGARSSRSSFETDYQDWLAKSKRGRSWGDETHHQLSPFSNGCNYLNLQPRVPFSVGLTSKLQNPSGDNQGDHTSQRNLSSWRNKHITSAFGSRPLLQVAEQTGYKTPIPQSKPNFSKSVSIGDGIDSHNRGIGSSNNVNSRGNLINTTAKISTSINEDEAQENEVDAKGKGVLEGKADDAKGKEVEGNDLVSGDAENLNAEEDDFK